MCDKQIITWHFPYRPWYHLHKSNWHNWYIIDSGVQHHKSVH